MKIDFRFMSIPKKEITLDKIKNLSSDVLTKRIHFGSTHKNALKRVEEKECQGKIILPFEDSINPMLIKEISAPLFKSKYGNEYYRKIHSEREYTDFERFIDKYKDIVFLRDHLDISIALSMNLDENNERTELGELEYQAKYNGDQKAESSLLSLCQKQLEDLPFYKQADFICAMPCSSRGERSLPRRIADNIAGLKNISDNVYWESKEKKLKDAESVESKLEILEASKLAIDRKLDGKAVFLLDDLYMSGISMQYVAMKLKEVGAKWVFGLCLVKSRNNTTR